MAFLFKPIVSTEELYNLYLQHSSIETDTRKLKHGDIFFALKGPNFNGNSFALQALEAGAAYAIVDEDIDDINNRIIRADDVLTTLQNLAKYHREQFSISFIGITGSNGKTTTKELIHAVLSSHFKTYTTQGNLNNHIGIPVTILRIKNDAELAIIEMGANHQKEIESYCVYAQPTHSIITNCGKAHLEGFGNVEGVCKAKGELYDYIRANKGTIFAYNDYEYLHSMSKGIEKIIWYGTKNGSITGSVETSEPFLKVAIKKVFEINTLQTQLVGNYNLPNILCAVAVGKHFSVPDEKIKQAIEGYTPSNSRSQLIDWRNNKVILDAYNANPSSMKAAIENFAAIKSAQKILMLGGMMELGDASLHEHENIIQIINTYKWENVVLVGGDFKNTHHSYIYFDTAAQAGNWLQQQHFANTYFLIKGSRNIQMEKVLE